MKGKGADRPDGTAPRIGLARKTTAMVAAATVFQEAKKFMGQGCIKLSLASVDAGKLMVFGRDSTSCQGISDEEGSFRAVEGVFFDPIRRGCLPQGPPPGPREGRKLRRKSMRCPRPKARVKPAWAYGPGPGQISPRSANGAIHRAGNRVGDRGCHARAAMRPGLQPSGCVLRRFLGRWPRLR